ncbi:MAG: hypothetical protein AABW91_01885 [Nanoarchaeota archaeon]
MLSIDDYLRDIYMEVAESSVQDCRDGGDNLPPIKYTLKVIERADGTYEMIE